MLLRRRLNLMILASISWPMYVSRLRIGRESICEPGRNASTPLMSIRRPPFVLSTTRAMTGVSELERSLDVVPNLASEGVDTRKLRSARRSSRYCG